MAERFGRGRRGMEQAQVDVALLAWVDRFRFVTFDRVAAFLGCSERRAAQRCRRLVRVGYLRMAAGGPAGRAVLYPTSRATQMLGTLRRKPGLTVNAIAHELAVIDTVLAVEADPDGWTVLTERECRRRQGLDVGRYSVPLPHAGSRGRERWPDLVLEHPDHEQRTAIEIELSNKSQERLAQIAAGYLHGHYHAIWLAGTPTLERRIARTADARSANSISSGRHRITVHPWTSDPAGLRSALLRTAT